MQYKTNKSSPFSHSMLIAVKKNMNRGERDLSNASDNLNSSALLNNSNIAIISPKNNPGLGLGAGGGNSHRNSKSSIGHSSSLKAIPSSMTRLTQG